MLKRLFTFSVLCVLSFVQLGYAQVAIGSKYMDVTPDVQKYSHNTPIEATWDVEFNYDALTVTGAAGNAGAVYIPTINKFWTSRWGSAVAHQWNADGTLDIEFTLPFTGTRGMAFDGQFVYHSINTTSVQIVDPATRTLVGNVPVTAAPNGARFITYNPDGDGGTGSIIVGNWTSPNLNFYEFSLTGTLLRTITSTVTGVYGLAYDNWSPGGPFLWVWSQGSGQGFPQYIMQMDYGTGVYTGVQHDVITDVGVGQTTAIAGGLFITDELVPGKVILGGMLQGAPDRLFGYELALTGPPCPVGPATDPTPVSGATNVSITPGNASWTNGAGTTQIEIHFGPAGNMTQVYSGSPITSVAIPNTPLNYATTYQWKVVCKNDTCSGAPAATWSFTTEQNPFYVEVTDTLYPQSAQYWTGSTNGTDKTDGEVRGANTEDGWFMFDVSSIPNEANILGVTFEGYVNLTNWPYWSATPLPGLNPLTATASELKTAIQANSGTAVAYLYQNEAQTFTTGWKSYALGGTVNADLKNSLVQDWFAMGMDSRDNSATYMINWDGWSQANIPSIIVHYSYVTPVELTSFVATGNENSVSLSWSTATETNNNGFQVERNSGNGFEYAGFVSGNGTTTEAKTYSFVDRNLNSGKYTYRLKQIDYNGTFEYSNAVEVEVLGVKEYTLNQNYPNPFNPSTVIKFNLAVDSKVSLKVFDVLGQEVATLLNGQMSAGSKDVTFDASLLNSGVYFYRIDASGVDGQKFSSTKKMILTK